MTKKPSPKASAASGVAPSPGLPAHPGADSAPLAEDPNAAALAPLAADDPANKTLGEIFGVAPLESPTQPSASHGFAMGDEPPPLPPGFRADETRPFEGIAPPEPAIQVHPSNPPMGHFPHAEEPYDPLKHAPIPPLERGTGQKPAADRAWRPPSINSPPEIISPSSVKYESRIKVLEAFRYPGSFRDAPQWVDRNWLAYGQYDPLRGIEPGPALSVPTSSGVSVMARIGDYVVQQEFIIEGERSVIQLEVWAADAFERTFMPVRSSLPPTRAGVEDAVIAA